MEAGQPWFEGCITGVGDACHATTPFLGQGGAMALEASPTLSIGYGLTLCSVYCSLPQSIALLWIISMHVRTGNHKAMWGRLHCPWNALQLFGGKSLH